MAKKRSKRPAAEVRPTEERKTGRGRILWISLSLAAVLGLEIWFCLGSFRLPFLDTRLHYSYDNAVFLFQSRCGDRSGDLRSQFGVTKQSYSRWGEKTGEARYYTDHPFLVKALFQQFTRIAGTEEWTSRVFSLAVSFGIAAGFFVIVMRLTASLLSAFAGTVVLVSLPLFAVYQTCIKFETDGMLAGVWVFAALTGFLENGKRSSLRAYGILAALAFLVHWTSALLVGAVGLWLLVSWLRRRDLERGRVLGATIVAGIAGIVLLALAFSYLQHGWSGALAELARSFSVRSAPVPLPEWWERQRAYLAANFTSVLLWAALAVAVFLAALAFRRARSSPPGLLAVFFFTTLAVAAVWLIAFRQGSFIHKYWQYWLCLPIATLAAAFVSSLKRSRLALLAGTAGCLALSVYLLLAAKESYAGVLKEQLGTPEDIAFLKTLRDDSFQRFVFVPVADTPLNQWFQGPLFEYYTDRPVVTSSSGSDVRAGDKALLLRFRQRESVTAAVSNWSGKTLANEKCGLRFCAYDVAAP